MNIVAEEEDEEGNETKRDFPSWMESRGRKVEAPRIFKNKGMK